MNRLHEDQRDYLNGVKDALRNLQTSLHALETEWLDDGKYEMDLNNFLKPAYPFSVSYDDLMFDTDIWINDGIIKINDLLFKLD